MGFLNTLVYSPRTGVRLFRHGLFWAADIGNYFIIVSKNGEVPVAFYSMLLQIPLVMLITYFILYYLIPRFSMPDQRWNVLLGVLAVILILGIGLRYYKIHVVAPWIDPEFQTIAREVSLSRFVSDIFAWMAIVCMAIAIKVVKSKAEVEQKNLMLQQEKKAVELNFLKIQMQPHFLFNTLNTLYSETMHESGKAERVVLHLSDLLRFILIECDKPSIAVEKEVKVIRDYLELEKLRHGSRLVVNLSTSDADPGLLISPLVLLPFVENSVKHSLNNLRGPVTIDISIATRAQRLHFMVENDHTVDAADRAGGSSYAGGNGIANVRRQLELLYDRAYDLRIDDGKGKYRVTLQIPAKPI